MAHENNTYAECIANFHKIRKHDIFESINEDDHKTHMDAYESYIRSTSLRSTSRRPLQQPLQPLQRPTTSRSHQRSATILPAQNPILRRGNGQYFIPTRPYQPLNNQFTYIANNIFQHNLPTINIPQTSYVNQIITPNPFITFFTNNYIMNDIAIPITQTSYNQMTEKTFHDIKNSEQNIFTECTICRGDYEDDDRLKILPCNHYFHTACIGEWLLNHNHICPICRQECGTNNPIL